ncbi:MAG TPA: single-stranded DNA-binding protein [Pseudomonas sp.]|nr:single-stranded DNA-binding protein [Pseudomonas sp.]
MAQLFDVARIGRDAVLRFTPNDGTAVVNLALACDYGRKDQQTGKRPTQWIDATLWGKQAEALAPYLLKGQQVAVTIDDVHIETYQGQNGPGHKLVGRISHIKLVGSAPQQQAQQQAQRQPAPQQQRQAAPQQQIPDYDTFDDDIPF